ncbi:MAG: PDZ domain-containing protein [Anaerolineae bacterium]|nr:PDZ domain-containing protein [Anaerolineae bacterium]
MRALLLRVAVAVLCLLSLTPAVASAQTAEEDRGLLVVQVAPGSPALQAGLRRGDIILSVAGQAVNTRRELADLLADLQPGDTVQVEVRRGDAYRTLPVELGERSGRAYLGVIAVGAGLDVGALDRFLPSPRMPQGRGQPAAVVVEVMAGSPAAQAGLQVGDMIVAVDGRPLSATADLAAQIAGRRVGDQVTLTVLRADGRRETVSVVLGEHPEVAGAPYLGVRYAPAGAPVWRQRLPLPGGEGWQPFQDWRWIAPDGRFYRNFPWLPQDEGSDLPSPFNLQEFLRQLRSWLQQWPELRPQL